MHGEALISHAVSILSTSGCSQMTTEERAEEGEQRIAHQQAQPKSTGALLPESLDYEQVENDVFRAEHYHQRERRHFYGCDSLH
eukprot:7116148-Pyramimonas_sp.AAC.1